MKDTKKPIGGVAFDAINHEGAEALDQLQADCRLVGQVLESAAKRGVGFLVTLDRFTLIQHKARLAADELAALATNCGAALRLLQFNALSRSGAFSGPGAALALGKCYAEALNSRSLAYHYGSAEEAKADAVLETLRHWCRETFGGASR